tara:strand:+ start:40 stop:534 length:495 start_codon:yes stop_codon:yes gene_type:complete
MRTLIILLFISFNSFGQTFDDLIKITSIEEFKRLCIEEGYQAQSFIDRLQKEIDVEIEDSDRALMEDNFTYYVFGNDEIIAFYDKSTPTFSFTFRLPFMWKELSTYDGYKSISNRIKNECYYQKIVNVAGIDYATYNCTEASFDGDIGFAVQEDAGWVRYFPKE